MGLKFGHPVLDTLIQTMIYTDNVYTFCGIVWKFSNEINIPSIAQVIRPIKSRVCEMLSAVEIDPFTADLSSTYAIYVIWQLLTRTTDAIRASSSNPSPRISTRCAALVAKHSLCILTMKVKCAIERLG